MHTNIRNKYIGKVLGWKSYGNNEEYFIDDFLNIEELADILAETYSSESHIGKDGIMFLQEYYGFKNLAKLLEENGGIESDLKDEDVIYKWLEILKKEAK
jgi:hypothetical protein